METLITYRTAKIAKEKKYDSKLLSYYQNHLKKGDYLFEQLIQNSTEYVSNFESNYGYDIDALVAPTQSVLQKWLREKHDIRLWCYFTTINDSETAWVWEIVKDNIKGKGRKKDTWDFYDRLDSFSEMTWFDDYEDCLEAGLVKALKLI